MYDRQFSTLAIAVSVHTPGPATMARVRRLRFTGSASDTSGSIFKHRVQRKSIRYSPRLFNKINYPNEQETIGHLLPELWKSWTFSNIAAERSLPALDEDLARYFRFRHFMFVLRRDPRPRLRDIGKNTGDAQAVADVKCRLGMRSEPRTRLLGFWCILGDNTLLIHAVLWLVAFLTPWGQESYAGFHLSKRMQLVFGFVKFSILLVCFTYEMVLLCIGIKKKRLEKKHAKNTTRSMHCTK
jgi:hypothetical protein